MSISVVIVAHRHHRWLEASLGSVLEQADEVVLIDNGSAESEVSATGRRLGARVLRSDKNLGFAGGANLGMRSATGEVLALLNDDAMAEPGWLSNASGVLVDESIAAVAPKTLFALPHVQLRFEEGSHFVPGDSRPLGRCISEVTLDGRDVLASLIGPGIHGLESEQRGGRVVRWRWTTGRGAVFVPLPEGADSSSLQVAGGPAPLVGVGFPINNAGSFLSRDGYGGDCGFGAADDGAFDQAADRFAASGVAMAMRRETLLRLGPFAPRFFAYYEDTDWCWRAQLGGLRIRYDPGGVVRHVGGVTSGGPQADFVRFLASRNRILALARNAPLRVLIGQLPKAWDEEHHPSLRRSLVGRLSEALVQRRALARRWRRSAVEVWGEWARVGETRSPCQQERGQREGGFR